MDKEITTTRIAIFQRKEIRKTVHNNEWWFSVVDVILALTDSIKPRVYWNAMKSRVKSEDGVELSTICRQLKLKSSDGKKYKTDCSNTKGMFRIIQSVPSSKAEPFKIWLAKVGYERLQETVDPELSVNRARRNWKLVGRSEKWIEQRMRGQEIRNKLTDYWSQSDVQEGIEYAKLTDIIHKEWAGLTTSGHKRLRIADRAKSCKQR